jgi:hypothetical protein
LIARKSEWLERDGGVRVRRDDRDGAAANLLLARGDSIPAVVPLAF